VADRVTPDLRQLSAFIARCVSVDLEVDPKSARIFSFAAITSNPNKRLVFERGDLSQAIVELGTFAGPAEFLLGHNIIYFDLPYLESVGLSAQTIAKPVIDTLWLNPLAFPRNPYHHLVKHYQDGRLEGGHVNDPKLDARLVLTVLENQIRALSNLNSNNPDMLSAYHWLTTSGPHSKGFDAVFTLIRGQSRPSKGEATAAINRLLTSEACLEQIDNILEGQAEDHWALSYAISWISVAGGDSVMSPWVRHQFPKTPGIVRKLRDTPCSNPSCAWCPRKNDPRGLLKNWFGFEAFRPEPVGEDGKPLQEKIVSEVIVGKNVLGILPTGTGKSICYQLPALSRFQKTGALTVVVSPLVALMIDQVEGLKRHGISSCVAINGMLSIPERHDALDKVRLGDAAILLISPEQLRNRSVRSVLKQREVGYWVLDEAHCVSKWGHDFRPDYRYIARFIKEYSGDELPAPLLCLTATAKPAVISDIVEHFQSRLGIELSLIDGGAVRRNLSFEVISTDGNKKLGDILAVLESDLPRDGFSGAIVYCATRSATERVAAFLKSQGVAATHFHAGLKPETKRDVQEQFRRGELRVIAATNAFGMGIDKSDVRVVVHGDIPNSLENYIQEAGRAGRDQDAARCVLLFSEDDVERQFSLNARSRLAKQEIGAILKALRRLDRRLKRNGEVVATSGEIVKEEYDYEFTRDSATDDTRVKIAVAWLEETALLMREENRVSVYPSTLRIRTLGEAEEILKSANIKEEYRRQLLQVVQRLVNANPDEGITTDELCGVSGLSPPGLRKSLNDLETLGIASNDTVVSTFVHIGVEHSSAQRLTAVVSLEADLISKLRELAPDIEIGETSQLNLKIASQELRDAGHTRVRPDMVDSIVWGLARDGRDDEEGIGSLAVRKIDREHISVRLQRNWDKLAKTADLRRKGAQVLLTFLESRAPRNSRGTDIQVETTLGGLMNALSSDLEIKDNAKNISRLLDRALLWLHEQQVITLGKGLTVFRPAITVHLEPGTRRFTVADFEPLQLHYNEQTLQVHIMEAYARLGLKSMSEASRFAGDYFALGRDAFVGRWLPSRSADLRRQTTPASWHAIVGSLNNQEQTRIVTDDRDQTNVLVMAGPGSGKTRVLVHRIAYLIRVRREDPRGILALVYNRHTATEIRRRLYDLIGNDARHVTVSTCHGLAMRLVGASFTKRAEKIESVAFDEIVKQAVSLLKGDGLSRAEGESQRETLIEGYRWIFVDEYQDIGPDEYELISAVAGRTQDDPDSRLSLFAVGDDDQNIYAFAGASVEFIRRFEDDYAARSVHLIENYRSTANIVDAANQVIAFAANRMKVGHDIVVNRARRNQPHGGKLETLDPIGRGRVQLLTLESDELSQAVAAVEELVHLAKVLPDWDWARTAVIAREWRFLQPVRSYCEAKGIPVQMATEELPPFWRLRETQTLIDWLESRVETTVTQSEIEAWLKTQSQGPWWTLLRQAASDFKSDFGERETYTKDVFEWLAEWGRDFRRSQTGLFLLTAHRAKGLEFEHVVLLDGAWGKMSRGEDKDGDRRLYYVAMTRARHSLTLIQINPLHPILGGIGRTSSMFRRRVNGKLKTEDCRKIYRQLDLSEIDLSFAGRLPANHPSVSAIWNLNVGDPIKLETEGDRFLLTNSQGVIVGRLAKKFEAPKGATFVGGQVFAIVARCRDDSSKDFHAQLRQERWEIIVPELIFTG
jgi:ATP-dependent DNA helicase RecQ